MTEEVYDFGQRLRQLRLSRNLSQNQVAKCLSLTRSSVSNYENNLAMPTLDTLLKLADLYRTSVAYMLNQDKRKVIAVDGLSEKQIAIVESTVEAFREVQQVTTTQNSRRI